MVRGLTPLYFPCNGNTEKGAFPTFYDEITLLNVVKYTCYQADGFKRSDWATSPLLRQRMPKTLYTREIHIQNSYTERSIQMPKVMIIECLSLIHISQMPQQKIQLTSWPTQAVPAVYVKFYES